MYDLSAVTLVWQQQHARTPPPPAVQDKKTFLQEGLACYARLLLLRAVRRTGGFGPPLTFYPEARTGAALNGSDGATRPLGEGRIWGASLAGGCGLQARTAAALTRSEECWAGGRSGRGPGGERYSLVPRLEERSGVWRGRRALLSRARPNIRLIYH